MDVVEIVVTAKNLTAAPFAQTKAGLTGVEAAAAKLHKTALVATGALVGVGVEAVRMASKFDSEMQLLNTQAGVSKDKIAGLKKGVLDLAGQVGQSPDSLAEALFHVESNFESMGITSQKALEITKVAAQGATVGHANLVDVTNALTAAVASGIPGVQNMSQAMGVLNATVGVGDMKMQDLASAFGGGMLATVKGFGLTIKDVGAALAVFGDNNLRGTAAATQLRMSVQALAKPVQGSGDALQKLGLQQDTLAKDMQRGGLKLALEDLVDRMHKAGISADQQGQIITDAFGRKAGSGLNTLVSEMDRLESKYPALAEGASKFGDAWAATQKTFAAQTKNLQASFDALMITLGEKLIPPLQKTVSFLLAHKAATVAAAEATAGLLAVTITLSAALKTAAAMQALWAAGSKAVAGLVGVYETAALKIMYMKDASVAAGGGLAGLKVAFAELGTTAKLAVGATGIGLLVIALTQLMDIGKVAGPSLDKLQTSLVDFSNTGKASGELAKVFGANLDELHKAANRLADPSLGQRIGDVLSSVTFEDGGPGLQKARREFSSLDDALSQLAQNGYADAAAQSFQRMASKAQENGVSLDQFRGLLPKYAEALHKVQSDQENAAATMGAFGKQAEQTSAQLDQQTQSAEGLQKALQDLNDVQRGALDAQAAFEAAIDAATKAAKDNGRALHERNGQLDLTTDKARAEEGALTDLAAKTDAATQAQVKNGATWDDVMKTYDRGRSKLIDAAEAMGLSADQANSLADKILRIPDPKLKVQLETQDAQAGLDAVIAKLKATKSKSVTVQALTGAAVQQLQSLGFKVEHLKNGQFKVTVQSGSAEAALAAVQARRDALTDKNITITTNLVTREISLPGSRMRVSEYAHGGIVGAAGGGPRSNMVLVGEQGPEYVRLPYGSTVIPNGATQGLLNGEREARQESRGAFGISHFGQMAGWSHNSFEKALGSPSDVTSLVGALNDWRSTIMKATHGSTENRLLKDLDVGGRALIRNQQAWDKVTSALGKAQDKLSSLKDSFAQLKDSVAQNIVSFGNITKAAGNAAQGGPRLTVSSIRGTLTDARDKATAFAGALATLKKRGLSADMLNQIAQAGIDGGGLDTATALLSASSGDIKGLNKLQGQIASAAGKAGQTTADAMYGAGIQAAQGLVDGLKKQQHNLERAMESIAKALERAIEKALRVPPARHHASGGVMGGGMSWVGEYGPELVSMPGAVAYPTGQSRHMAAGGYGGAAPQPLQINLYLGGQQVGNVMVELMRNAIRVRGGNVQTVLGKGY